MKTVVSMFELLWMYCCAWLLVSAILVRGALTHILLSISQISDQRGVDDGLIIVGAHNHQKCLNLRRSCSCLRDSLLLTNRKLIETSGICHQLSLPSFCRFHKREERNSWTLVEQDGYILFQSSPPSE
jgi:hypothetical protein